MTQPSTLTIAMTGASGAPYTLALLKHCLDVGIHVYFLCSPPGQIVLATETDLKLPDKPQAMKQRMLEYFDCPSDQLDVYSMDQWMAPIASGSSVADAMVVCPCSMGSLASIANGISNNLIHRAADVSLKEGRKLVLLPREAPFSSLHLENMLKLSKMGAVILPPNPAFYQGVSCIEDLVNFVVSRTLDVLGIENQLSPRWGRKGSAK